MRILNLVLYSNDESFDSMKDITSQYYKTFENVTTLYFKYTPSLQQDVLLDGDILHIKGNESYVPGILSKTLKAFEYAANISEQYDFVIRTNISTVINLNLLSQTLSNHSDLYYGGILCQLKYITEGSGIDPKYKNFHYVSGLGIILSKDALKYVVHNNELIDKNIIDDVAIGILFATYRKDINIINICPPDTILFTSESITNISDMSKYHGKVIFYRNKSTHDRSLDVEKMKIIVSYLKKYS